MSVMNVNDLLDDNSVTTIDPNTSVAEIWTLERAESERERALVLFAVLFAVLLAAAVSVLATSTAQPVLVFGATMLAVHAFFGLMVLRSMARPRPTATMRVPDAEPINAMLEVADDFGATLAAVPYAAMPLFAGAIDLQVAQNLWCERIVRLAASGIDANDLDDVKASERALCDELVEMLSALRSAIGSVVATAVGDEAAWTALDWQATVVYDLVRSELDR
jgi:hypothetical protein